MSRYGLLTETSGVEKTHDLRVERHYPRAMALSWLKAGWLDLAANPLSSLAYGLVIFLVSAAVVYVMFAFGWDYVLFPALSGFLIVAPVLALGLYQKSRALDAGEKTRFRTMLLTRAASGAQTIFAGLLLMLLTLLWMRAAVLLYALFFGYRAFPGFDQMVGLLLQTPEGWGLLITGTVVGGLFASLGFAVSAFSIPMLMAERTDAFTAMGTSMKLVWNNLEVMLAWGAIVLVLLIVSLLTGLLGLIIVFPVLGHATWHAYKAVKLGETGRGPVKRSDVHPG